MFPFLTLFWSWDSCCWSMSKDDHFPIVSFVWQAFLLSVRFLLMHPVELRGSSIVSSCATKRPFPSAELRNYAAVSVHVFPFRGLSLRNILFILLFSVSNLLLFLRKLRDFYKLRNLESYHLSILGSLFQPIIFLLTLVAPMNSFPSLYLLYKYRLKVTYNY